MGGDGGHRRGAPTRHGGAEARRGAGPPPARGHGPRRGDTARSRATCAAKAERTGRGTRAPVLGAWRAGGCAPVMAVAVPKTHAQRPWRRGAVGARRASGTTDRKRAGRYTRGCARHPTGPTCDGCHEGAQNRAHGEPAARLDPGATAAGKRGTGGHTAPQDGPEAHARKRAAAKAKNHTTGHVGARGLSRERQRTGASEAQASRFLHRGQRAVYDKKGVLLCAGLPSPFVACATKGESCCAGEALHPMGQTTHGAHKPRRSVHHRRRRMQNGRKRGAVARNRGRLWRTHSAARPANIASTWAYARHCASYAADCSDNAHYVK